MNDHEIAGLLAREAGELLLELREKGLDKGVSGYQLQVIADREAHLHISKRLKELCPEDFLLSEEGRDDKARLEAERVWIVDPLDGTQDYGRMGSIEWAVHVALVSGGQPLAGAVNLPAIGTLYGTLQTPTKQDSVNNPPVVITSRSQWGEAEAVAASIGGVVRSVGSAGVKAMAVVGGTADIYVHPSGLYEWDVCAPAAVAASAGLDVSGVDGSFLTYNKERPVVPVLLISKPEYTAAALDALHY